MKRILLLLIAVMAFSYSSYAQPDYSIITFKSKIHYYKKTKPSFKEIEFKKEDIQRIVTILGEDFYSTEEIDELTEKIWLSFIDPEKFDYVFKDLAIRTLPNWNKVNAVGTIILEPNPFVSYWTEADGELQYFQKALYLILVQHNIMAYSEDAKSTRASLQKLLYTKELPLRGVWSSDWTNSYLQYTQKLIENKNLSILIAKGNYQYLVCKTNDVGELTALFKKMSWSFVAP